MQYREFLDSQVNRESERFFAYLFSVSGWGEQRCQVNKKERLIRIFHMFAAKEKCLELSFTQLAFCLRLAFRIDQKTETLVKYICDERFYPETFFDLAEAVMVYF